MSATFEKIATNRVKMTFSVPAAEFDAAMQKAYLKVRGQINIPGFRKGKAPRALIEKMYSEAVFYDDAINMVLPDAYDAAVKETGIYPVDQPDCDVVEVASGKDLVLTAEVTVKPEVVLGEYKGLEVEKKEAAVSDEDIDAEINRAREREASWEAVERPVESGDQIKLDYAGTVDGVAFAGGTATDATLEIGSNTFIPGFEDQLIGVAAGEEKDVVVTFPEEYHEASLSGKEAVFHCTVKEIKVKDLPELDDEFAKDVSEFETFDEYKADVRVRLEKQAADRAQAQLENELVDAACANAQVEIPECMIKRQSEYMLQEMEYRLMYQGIRMEQYLQMTSQTRDDLMESFKDEAARRVKVQLVLEAIQKAENLEATDEDIDAELAPMATEEHPVEAVRASMQESDLEYYRETALSKKTVKVLTDSAVIK